MKEQKIYIVLVTDTNDADPIAGIFYSRKDAVVFSALLNKEHKIIEKSLALHRLFYPLFTFF